MRGGTSPSGGSFGSEADRLTLTKTTSLISRLPRGNICYGIYHTSGGRTFTANVQDESDFWEFSTGQPQFKYVEIDLAARSSLGAVPGLPTTYGTQSYDCSRDGRPEPAIHDSH